MKEALHVPAKSRLVALIVLLLVYVITARIGLSLPSVNTFAAFIWPPTGIAIAALLLYGEDLWPAIALGALVVNVSLGATLFSAVGIAIGNTFEAFLAAYALRRWGFSGSFDRIGTVIFFVASAFVAPLVSATIGVGALSASGAITSTAFARTWIAWWGGDVLGALLLTPLLVSWFGRERTLARGISLFELYCLMLATVALDFFIFWGTYATPLQPPLIYLVIIPFLWSTLRLGPRGKTSVMLVTAIIAIAGTISGRGPFSDADQALALGSLQYFLAAISVTFLAFASVIEELSRTRAELEEYAGQLERALQTTREGKVGRVPESTLGA